MLLNALLKGNCIHSVSVLLKDEIWTNLLFLCLCSNDASTENRNFHFKVLWDSFITLLATAAFSCEKKKRHNFSLPLLPKLCLNIQNAQIPVGRFEAIPLPRNLSVTFLWGSVVWFKSRLNSLIDWLLFENVAQNLGQICSRQTIHYRRFPLFYISCQDKTDTQPLLFHCPVERNEPLFCWSSIPTTHNHHHIFIFIVVIIATSAVEICMYNKSEVSEYILRCLCSGHT